MNQVPDYRDQIKYGGYAIYENPSGNKDILLKSKLWRREVIFWKWEIELNIQEKRSLKIK